MTGVASRLWLWQLQTTGAVRFTSRVAGAVTLNSDTTAVLNNDTWYHLCAVRDGTNQILYVNGVAVDYGRVDGGLGAVLHNGAHGRHRTRHG